MTPKMRFSHRLVDAPADSDLDRVAVPDPHDGEVTPTQILIPDTDLDPCEFCDHAPAVEDGFCEACADHNTDPPEYCPWCKYSSDTYGEVSDHVGEAHPPGVRHA